MWFTVVLGVPARWACWPGGARRRRRRTAARPLDGRRRRRAAPARRRQRAALPDFHPGAGRRLRRWRSGGTATPLAGWRPPRSRRRRALLAPPVVALALYVVCGTLDPADASLRGRAECPARLRRWPCSARSRSTPRGRGCRASFPARLEPAGRSAGGRARGRRRPGAQFVPVGRHPDLQELPRLDRARPHSAAGHAGPGKLANGLALENRHPADLRRARVRQLRGSEDSATMCDIF